MNHAHHHPDAAPDETAAGTDQHAAHAPATTHQHHAAAGHEGKRRSR